MNSLSDGGSDVEREMRAYGPDGDGYTPDDDDYARWMHEMNAMAADIEFPW